MNTPFRNLRELQHPQHDNLPPELKPIAYIIRNHHDFLLNKEALSSFLHAIGYNSVKIENFIRFKDAMCTFFYKYLNDFSRTEYLPPPDTMLHFEQQGIITHIILQIQRRTEYFKHITQRETELLSDTSSESFDDDFTEYSCLASSESGESGHSSESEDDSLFQEREIHVKPRFSTCDDRGINIPATLISGLPGTGKTFLLHKVVEEVLTENHSVCFACPTAHQARIIKPLYVDNDNVICDTIHSLFRISIHEKDGNSINWGLHRYDIIIIDEVAMVSYLHIEHVFTTIHTLATSPVLILCGDPRQQQPLTTTDGRTTTGLNIFGNRYLLSRCNTFKLYRQHRSSCIILCNLLGIIREAYPTHSQLHFLNDKAYCRKGLVTDNVIIFAFRDRPESTFLTITRRGSSQVNKCIIHNLYHNEIPLAIDVQMDDGTTTNIYQGMQIVITKNINKRLHIVNGECGHVIDFINEVMMIRLRSRRIVFLHQTTREDNCTLFYPFLLNYSSTIYKSQGKTLQSVILWLDNDVISPGAAYVALSRVRCHNNFALLEGVNIQQICKIPCQSY